MRSFASYDWRYAVQCDEMNEVKFRHNVLVYEKFCRLPFFNYIIKGGEIWVKEKVSPLIIIFAFFLEPHILCCYMM
jgi:hypothetical protein